jgi:hypothetical protein
MHLMVAIAWLDSTLSRENKCVCVCVRSFQVKNVITSADNMLADNIFLLADNMMLSYNMILSINIMLSYNICVI